MIYTKPIDSISWDDVQSFVKERVPEGANLEYKEDFPVDLARTIAAMANTIGGVILIGVAEENGGRPVCPAVGLQFSQGLAERVTNIVLSSITPPILPETAVCADPSAKNAFVVVRVPQSPDGPHAIQKNTRAYVRTNNCNNPESLATLEEIAWLQARRARSTALRDQIGAQAMYRSSVLFGHVARMAGITTATPAGATANLVLKVVPVFPGHAFVQPPNLREILRSIQVLDYYGTDNVFPLGGSNATLLQDGAYVSATIDGESGKRSYYTELNVFGQLLFRQTLTTKYMNKRLIRASELFCRLDEFSRTAKRFFEALGYQGYVSMLCSLHSAHTAELGIWTPDERGLPTTSCPDDSIGHEEIFMVGDWDVGASSAIFAAARTIGWAYNWEFGEDLLQAYYKLNRRLG